MWYEYYKEIQLLSFIGRDLKVVCGINITRKYNMSLGSALNKSVVCGMNITRKYNFSFKSHK
jgi:hypothetical protein